MSSSSGGPGQPVVDQYNGVATGGVVCGGKQIITQTFTPGITGQLAGIEVGAGLLNAPPAAHLRMRVIDLTTNQELGSAIIPAANFPPGYGKAPDMQVIGPGYFDFINFGIKNMAGQMMMFELTSPDQLPGVCMFGMCQGQPMPCQVDADCQPGPPDLGLSDSNTNPYPGGVEFVNGTMNDVFDLAFKTLVIP